MNFVLDVYLGWFTFNIFPLMMQTRCVNDDVSVTNVGRTRDPIISKKDWGGLNESSSVIILKPIQYLVITHTAGNFCYRFKDCSNVLQNIQKDQMSRTPAFADIANNFLVGGDGNIYEGRGWDKRSALQSFVNNKNYDICFIGDFSVYDNPTAPQIEGVKKLIKYGLKHKYISHDYILLAHNASGNGATLSPGVNVYSVIKEWDHFHANPIDEIEVPS